MKLRFKDLSMALLLVLAPFLSVALGAGHGEDVKPVVPPTVWGILIFIAVLVILWWKAFPPITQALDKRARSIQESLEAADRAKKESEALLAKHEESMEKARAEARAIIEEGKSEAQRVKDRIVESARKETESLSERARREIELAKKSAIEGLHRQAVDLSLEIAAKLIHKNLKAEDHKKLIQESIKKYKKVN